MTHDVQRQRAETFAAFEDIASKADLPDEADIDYVFVPTAQGSLWEPLAKALSNSGYDCQWFAAETADETGYLVATLPEQVVSATGIWIGEEVATTIALKHGFAPDGWGFNS